VLGLKSSFNRILVEVVGEVINRLLGEPVASILLYHLEKDFSLRIEDIPEKPERFEYAMKDLFHESAHIIEEKIIEELYRRLDLNYRRVEGQGFAECIKEAKKLYERLHREN